MSVTRRSALAGIIALAGASALPVTAMAAPSASLLDGHWQQFGANGDPDNSAWGAFLSKYVIPGPTGVNLVNYGGVTPADRQALKGYVASLEAARPTAMTREAAFAYWTNLYNAKTIDIILDNYPVESIRQIGGGLFSRGPWDSKVVTVEGRQLSLNDIEHGIMRPIWGDPRIHYAVNCASIGCPNLAMQPYTAANLNPMLDKAARDFINHPRGASVQNGRLVVSSIFEWYQVDFGGTDGGVIAHMRQYATGPLAAALGSVSSVYDDQYDWNLNQA